MKITITDYHPVMGESEGFYLFQSQGLIPRLDSVETKRTGKWELIGQRKQNPEIEVIDLTDSKVFTENS